MRVRRLLLFIDLEDQRNDADDQNAELEQVGISDHDITPLLSSGGGTRRSGLLPKRRGHAYRTTGSASAYPCAEDIIARFVEFGKMGEKPRRGGSFRHGFAVPPPFDKGGCPLSHG